MHHYLSKIFAAFVLTFSASAQAQTVIYEDDFESGAAGWSDNTVTNAATIGTNFLGRFGGNTTDTSRTFTLPAGATSLDIEFDLLRWDSWDFFNAANQDGFTVLIDGNPIFSTDTSFAGPLPLLPFPVGQGPRSGTTGNVDWAHIRLNPTDAQVDAGGAEQELGFNSGQFWFDQIHRFTITVNNPGASVELTLRMATDQTIPDESIGYDNFLVTAMAPAAPPVIIAANDSQTLQSSAAAQPNILNVVDNDTFDGAAPTSFDLAINSASSLPPELTFDTVTGDVGLAAAAPIGTYSFDYDICESGTANCETATVTVTVELPNIDAVDNDFAATPIDPVAGGTTASIFANDTIGGAGVTENDVTVSLIDDGRLIGLVINTDGTLTVPAPTDPGIYQIDYEICDSVNPTNCDSATATIEISGAPTTIPDPLTCGTWIRQGWETYGSPSGHNAITFNSGNYANDPYVYLPMSRSADGRITTNFGPQQIEDSGLSSDRAGSGLTTSSQVDPDHTSEINSFIYRLEGKANTSETITFDTISAAEYTAHWVEDSAGNVLSSSDFINTRVTAAGEDFPVTLNYPADGVLFLRAVIFDPTFQYGRPTLPDYECPEADLVTVKTLADGGDSAPGVGDTVSFEITVTHNGDDQATNVTLTDSLPAGLTAAAGNGAVAGTGTSTGGSYDVATGLWDIGTLEDGETATLTLTGTVDAGQAGNVITNTLPAPAASDQTDPTTDGDDLTESVTIDNLIEASSETFPAIDGTTGGATSSVLASDTLNGAAVTLGNITITVDSSAPELTLDPNTGLITVAANTAAGTYTVEYTICENANPTNCDVATETVIVEVSLPSLTMTKVANDPGPYTVGDVVTYTYTATNNGDTIIRDITISDVHNGSDPAPTPTDETLLTDTVPFGDSTDAAANGSWDVLAPGDVVTFTGTYTVTQTDAENL